MARRKSSSSASCCSSVRSSRATGSSHGTQLRLSCVKVSGRVIGSPAGWVPGGRCSAPGGGGVLGEHAQAVGDPQLEGEEGDQLGEGDDPVGVPAGGLEGPQVGGR